MQVCPKHHQHYDHICEMMMKEFTNKVKKQKLYKGRSSALAFLTSRGVNWYEPTGRPTPKHG
jgi:hypothetical protein